MTPTRISRFIYQFIAAVTALVFTLGCSCSSEDEPQVEVPNKIEVVPYTHSMKMGTTQQYYAVGIYEDGSKKELTEEVTWSASDKELADISALGLLRTIKQGELTIAAKFEGVSGETTLTVHDKNVEALQVTPANAVLVVDQLVEYRVVAIFEDGTSRMSLST